MWSLSMSLASYIQYNPADGPKSSSGLSFLSCIVLILLLGQKMENKLQTDESILQKMGYKQVKQ
jgi:hypothetical protein